MEGGARSSMGDRGGKWWGHIGWVAQPRDDTLASVVLTQGTAQMCWGQARQDTLGPEQEEQLQAEPSDASLRSIPIVWLLLRRP